MLHSNCLNKRRSFVRSIPETDVLDCTVRQKASDNENEPEDECISQRMVQLELKVEENIHELSGRTSAFYRRIRHTISYSNKIIIKFTVNVRHNDPVIVSGEQRYHHSFIDIVPRTNVIRNCIKIADHQLRPNNKATEEVVEADENRRQDDCSRPRLHQTDKRLTKVGIYGEIESKITLRKKMIQ